MSILNIILFQVHAVQIFSSVLWVAFYTLLIMSSDTQKLSIFMRSNLFVFFFRLLPVFLSLHPRDYCQILGWPESSFGFKVKIKDTFFILTKNCIEQCIHCSVPLPSAIFQAPW